MKRVRLLIIVILVLTALSVAAYFLVFKEDVPEHNIAEIPEETGAPLLSAGNDAEEEDAYVQLIELEEGIAVEEVKITRGDESFTIIITEGTEEGENMSASVLEYPNLLITDTAFRDLLFGVMLASSKETISESGADLSDYGLQEPEGVCEVITEVGVQRLYLGNSNPAGTARYVMREGDEAVYLVQNYYADTLFPTLYAIREKTLAPVNAPELLSVRVFSGEEPLYVLVRYENEDPFDPGLFPLYFTHPFDPPKGVSDSKYFELLTLIQEGVNVVEFIDDPQDLSEYGLDKDSATTIVLEAADESGMYLMLGDVADDGLRYVLQPGTESPVLLLPEEMFAFAEIEIFDYVESFATLVGIDNVRGFNLTADDLQIEGEIIRSGSKETDDLVETFMINGQEVEEDPFKDFYQVMIGRQIEGPADDEVVQSTMDEEAEMRLEYVHVDDASLKKVVELYPYDNEFLVLSVDGGNRKFLVGRYQLDYILDQAEILF